MLTTTEWGPAVLLVLAALALHPILVLARGRDRKGNRGGLDGGGFWFGGDGCGDGGD